jgi:tetratricopeptide (TPR) repeat protein
MSMDKEELNELKRQAERDISKAEDKIAAGNIEMGLRLYERAIDAFFEIGSYLKIAEMFIRISTLLDKETTIYEAMDYLRRTKSKLHKLDIPEEEAKIAMTMGNLAFKINDFISAAENYEECAELYLKAEPEEYKIPSAMFLIRAAECYEFLKKHEKGERILIAAVIRLNKTNLDYQAVEYKGLKLIQQKKWSDALPLYQKLYDFFQESMDSLSKAVENSQLVETAIHAKTRLIHIISEYRLILMILDSKMGIKEQEKEWALESIDQLNSALELIKGMIKRGNWSRTDLKIYTYIGFMRAYFQKFEHIKNKSRDQQIQIYLAEGLTGEPLEVLKTLPYFDLCTKTESYGLEYLNEEISKFNLGRLEKYKKLIIDITQQNK